MKISKSFKIITFIFLGFLFVNNPFAYAELPNNLVIHDKPKKISNITFKDINLQNVDLSKNKGKIMILNFWATWCAPCKKEMPSLEKLAQNLPNINVYPINMEPPNKLRVRDFLLDINVVSLNTYFDPKLDLVKKLKLIGMPTTVLLDKEGNEFGRIIGEFDFNEKSFIKFLDEKSNL
jgi:thiol-disulfide isomerase/thioredoxin